MDFVWLFIGTGAFIGVCCLVDALREAGCDPSSLKPDQEESMFNDVGFHQEGGSFPGDTNWDAYPRDVFK